VFVDGLGNDICCPFVDQENNLFFILQDSGEVIAIDPLGDTELIHCTSGQPSGAVFDDQGILYISDFAHGAVLAVHEAGNDQQELVVGVYEDKPLKGPHSIVAGSDGNLFFTDSGPLGETGLQAPDGSLFVISNSPSGQILKPISLRNLAGPTGIAVSPDGKFIYLAEMMKNRVLRFFQKPEGAYHGSVFIQLSGGVGPSCLALDAQGSLYVGQFETKDAASPDGVVYVISPEGKQVATILVEGPEISGLVVCDNNLYITERSTGSIYKMGL